MNDKIAKLTKLADEFARAQVNKFGSMTPSRIIWELPLAKVEWLADIYKVDKDVVRIGAMLMDCQLGEATKQGRTDHEQMGAAAFEKLFIDSGMPKSKKQEREIFDKIENCILAHHRKIPYTCIEAEICANADCYKFITPRGVFNFAMVLGQRNGTEDNFDENIKAMDFKLNEKWNTVSLPEVRAELEPYYNEFQRLINEAKSI